MAIGASSVWEVRSGGSDTNGGGYDSTIPSAGTDYSQQDAAQLSVADGVGVGTTTLTSVTGGFTSAMIGNALYISSDTAWYFITARTNTNTVTVDRATGTFTGATVNVGGALASPGQAAGVRVLGNTVYIKYNATPYTIASTSPNVATGVVGITYNGSDSVEDLWIGYDTTRTVLNTDANRPTWKVAGAGVATVTLFDYNPGSTVANVLVRNIILDGNAKTAIKGFSNRIGNGGFRLDNCAANNCTNSSYSLDTGRSMLLGCSASGCSTVVAYNCLGDTVLLGCTADSNTVTAFAFGTAGKVVMDRCIASNNSGGSSDGFSLPGGQVGLTATNCLAYNNGRDGFRQGSGNARGVWATNCIAYGNGGVGFNNSGGSPTYNYLCAGGSNTSGNESSITHSFGFVTLTTDPFTNAAGGDFSLNNTAGGGAACRAAGFPGAFPGGTTTGYLDIGAAQHADPVGGGGAAQLINSNALVA